MILWTRAFQDEIGESANDIEYRVDGALAAEHIWLWDENGETTSMAVGREPAQGVVRLSGVLYATREAKARLRGSLRSCVVETSSRLWLSVHSLHGLGQPYIEFHLPANWI